LIKYTALSPTELCSWRNRAIVRLSETKQIKIRQCCVRPQRHAASRDTGIIIAVHLIHHHGPQRKSDWLYTEEEQRGTDNKTKKEKRTRCNAKSFGPTTHNEIH